MEGRFDRLSKRSENAVLRVADGSSATGEALAVTDPPPPALEHVAARWRLSLEPGQPDKNATSEVASRSPEARRALGGTPVVWTKVWTDLRTASPHKNPPPPPPPLGFGG